VDAGIYKKSKKTIVEVVEEPEEIVEPEEEEPILEEEPVFVKKVPEDEEGDEVESDKPKDIVYRPTKPVKEIKVSKEPEEGTIEIIDGLIVYSPGPNFDGMDSITLILVGDDGEEEEFTLDIIGEIPQGFPDLPKTGGLPTDIFVGFGTLLIAAGIGFKKYKFNK